MVDSVPEVYYRPALHGVLRGLEYCAQLMLQFAVPVCHAARTWKPEHHFYELMVSSFTQNGEVCTDGASVAMSALFALAIPDIFPRALRIGSHLFECGRDGLFRSIFRYFSV